MRSLIIRWIILTVAILIAARLIPGLPLGSLQTAFLAAVLLSLLNAFVRPILVFLTLPINILTLGLFLLVINAVLLSAVSWILDRGIPHFGAAFLGALVISIISTLLHFLVGDKERKS
jgi:putative membrane protein